MRLPIQERVRREAERVGALSREEAGKLIPVPSLPQENPLEKRRTVRTVGSPVEERTVLDGHRARMLAMVKYIRTLAAERERASVFREKRVDERRHLGVGFLSGGAREGILAE